MATQSKVPKKKSQTGKSSKKKEEEKRLGFFYVLAVALIVFAVCSILYYNFQDKIPHKIPMIGDKGDAVPMRLYFAHAKSKHHPITGSDAHSPEHPVKTFAPDIQVVFCEGVAESRHARRARCMI